MEEEEAVALMDGISSSSSSSDGDINQSDSENEYEILDIHLQEDINNMVEEELLFPLFHVILHGRRLQRVENFLATVHAKSDKEFREDFRIHRRVTYLLLQSLEVSGYIPTHRDGKEKISAEWSLLITLWFLANKDPHRNLANLFNVSFSSVSRILRRVIDWMVTLEPEFIRWPERDRILKTSNEFEMLAGVRGCIGAIDGCHICIDQPEFNGREYFNRKQSYSINLQGVVDSNMKFMNIYCGDPGSYHDIRVLRRSDLFNSAEQNHGILFPNNTFIIGDKGYSGVGRKWIVCPFRDNGQLTVDQNQFNTRLARTRVIVERAFGVVKGRFRRLQKIQMRSIEFAVKIVVACCVLHNICLENGDDGEDIQVANEEIDMGEDAEDHGRNAENRRDVLFREMFL